MFYFRFQLLGTRINTTSHLTSCIPLFGWYLNAYVIAAFSLSEVSDQSGVILQDNWLQPKTEHNIPTMESELGQHAQEESDIFRGLTDQIDLINFLDPEQTFTDNCTIGPAPANDTVYEEVGGIPDVNFNVQVKNDDMQIIFQTPTPITQSFPPPQELPPVKNEVQGLVVSNSGQLVTSHTTAAFSGGGNQQDYPFEATQMTELIFQEIDPDQFAVDELLKCVDPNLVMNCLTQPMIDNSNQVMNCLTQPITDNSNQAMMETFSQVKMDNFNQATMENSSQAMMENPTQVMMENSSHYKMATEGPMEETATGAFAVQVTT